MEKVPSPIRSSEFSLFLFLKMVAFFRKARSQVKMFTWPLKQQCEDCLRGREYYYKLSAALYRGRRYRVCSWCPAQKIGMHNNYQVFVSSGGGGGP